MPSADRVSSTREPLTEAADHNSFRPDIEGLRAVAVLAVVLFHAAVPGWNGGYVGVDVFFVISGFLITGLLWREMSATGSVRLRKFYGARARRLLPASALVGVVTMVAAAVLLPPLQVASVLRDGVLSALYVSNYRFMQEGVDYFNADRHLAPSPFLHYWSLGVEEQFYLVWAPLLLGVAWLVRTAATRRKRTGSAKWRVRRLPFLIALTLVTIVSFAMSVALTSVSPTAAFYSLPTRAWQLALGGLVALTVGQWRRLPPPAAGLMGWSGLILILLACTQFSPAIPYPGTAALVPTLGAVLVIAAGCATPTRNCGRLLAVAPVRAVGRISYSWYLWHWPVLIFAPMVTGHTLGLLGRVTAALVAAGLAWLTLRFVENPLRFAPNIRRSPRRSLVLGGAVTAAAVVTGLILIHAIPQPVGRGVPATPLNVATTRLPAGADRAAYESAIAEAFAQVRAAVAASARLTAVPSNLDPPLVEAENEETSVYLGGCMRNFFDVGHPECVTGDASSDTTVALVGDSHAAMWFPAFDRLSEDRRWRLETLARAGCPLLELPIESPVLHREYTECHRWRTEIISRLSDAPPDLVVLSSWRGYGSPGWPSGFTSYDSAWLESLTQMVRRWSDVGSHVLVLGPIPDPQSVVPVCVSDHLDDASACAPTRSTAIDAAGIAAEAAAVEAGGGRYVDLTDLFCTADRCPVIIGNTLVYFDRNHVSLEYARTLAPAMGALTDLAMSHG